MARSPRSPLREVREASELELTDIEEETGIEWAILHSYDRSPSACLAMSIGDAALIAQCCGVTIETLVTGASPDDQQDSSQLFGFLLRAGRKRIGKRKLANLLGWTSGRLETAIAVTDRELSDLGARIQSSAAGIKIDSTVSAIPNSTAMGDDTADELSRMSFAAQVLGATDGIAVDLFPRALAEGFVEEGVFQEHDGRYWPSPASERALGRQATEVEEIARYHREIEKSCDRARRSQPASVDELT